MPSWWGRISILTSGAKICFYIAGTKEHPLLSRSDHPHNSLRLRKKKKHRISRNSRFFLLLGLASGVLTQPKNSKFRRKPRDNTKPNTSNAHKSYAQEDDCA